MRISALLLGTLVAVGCSSAANKKLDEFADRACQCPDAECGQKVLKDFEAWAKDNKDARGNESQAEKAIKKMGDCLAKLSKKTDKAGDKDKDKDEKAAGKPDDKATDKPADKTDDK